MKRGGSQQLFRSPSLCSAISGSNHFDPGFFHIRRSFRTADVVTSPLHHAVKEHERQHYTQFVGTSFGVFLTLLERNSTLRAVDILQNARDDARLRAALNSAWAEKSPAILVDHELALDIDRVLRMGVVADGGLSMYMSEIAQCMFLDAALVWHLPDRVRAVALKVALEDCSLLCGHYGRASMQGFQADPGSFDIGPVLVESSHAGAAQVELTTRHILECAAVAAELFDPCAELHLDGYTPLRDARQLIVVPDQLEGEVADSVRDALSGRRVFSSPEDHIVFRLDGLARESEGLYTRAADYALAKWYRLASDSAKSLERLYAECSMTLSVCCDAALNPRIPGIHAGHGEDVWGHLYPPSRFRAFVDAVPDLGLLPLGATEAEYQDYLAGLSVAAGIDVLAASSGILPATERYDLKSALKEDGLSPHVDRFELVLWCMDRHAEVRSANPVECVNMGRLMNMSPDLMDRMLDKEGSYVALACPFIHMLHEDRSGVNPPLNLDLHRDFVRHTLHGYVAKQLLAEFGGVDLDGIVPSYWFSEGAGVGESPVRVMLRGMADTYNLDWIRDVPVAQ